MNKKNSDKPAPSERYPMCITDLEVLCAFVEGKVSNLPLARRERARSNIWSQTLAVFHVSHMADLARDQLDSVRAFIASYTASDLETATDTSIDMVERATPIQRLLVYSSGNGNRQVQLVPHDAYVMTHQSLIKALAQQYDQPFSRNEVLDLLTAAVENLRWRSTLPRRMPSVGRLSLSKARYSD